MSFYSRMQSDNSSFTAHEMNSMGSKWPSSSLMTQETNSAGSRFLSAWRRALFWAVLALRLSTASGWAISEALLQRAVLLAFLRAVSSGVSWASLSNVLAYEAAFLSFLCSSVMFSLLILILSFPKSFLCLGVNRTRLTVFLPLDGRPRPTLIGSSGS